MKKLITILTAACAAAACGPKGAGTVPVVDVTKSYPARSITLQDVAEVEYLPLETREGFYVDHLKVDYMDDELIVIHNNDGDIMFFDRNTGKGIASFNRKGRGPGEYVGIFSMVVDRAGGELFVTPNSLNAGMGCSVYVYDMAGKPLRTLNFKGLKFPRHLADHDGGHLSYYNEDTSSHEPYWLLSKTDTVTAPLPVSFAARETMTITQETEMGKFSVSSGNPIAKADEGYMLSEPGTDTIFHLTGSGEFRPVMAQTPRFASMEYPTGIFYTAQSSDYIFFQSIERKYDEETGGFKRVNLVYEKPSGQFYEGKVLNTDYADPKELWAQYESGRMGLPAGTFVYGVQPFELLDLHEAGKLRGRLAEIAPTLKEEDNPVMMIVKFK
jgi:DNA-binding beta-propeller fold protein YncE